MASSLYTQRCEDFEVFVGNLPYSEDLTYDDYRFKRGLFARACTSGRRPWNLKNSYIESLEECLTNALISVSDYDLPWEDNMVEVHKIVNPLTYEDPKEATESNHFRPYAFVKCVNGIKGRLLLKAGYKGIKFKDSILRLAISKGIPSDQPNNISDEINTNSSKKSLSSGHSLF